MTDEATPLSSKIYSESSRLSLRILCIYTDPMARWENEAEVINTFNV